MPCSTSMVKRTHDFLGGVFIFYFGGGGAFLIKQLFHLSLLDMR